MSTPAAGDDLLLRAAPFLSSVMQIEPHWIDHNGHLNMAYYNVMFDRAIDEMWLQLGIGRLRGQPRRGMRVLVADRLRGDQPVAESRRERFHGARQRLRFRAL